MKSSHTVTALFVASVAAQANNLTPIDQLVPDVQPFATELNNVRLSVNALDTAIVAFQNENDVAPTLQAAQNLLDTINAEAADALTHPQISENTTTDAGTVAVGPILDYASALINSINQTVTDLIAKEDVAIKYCQGPTVLQAVEDQNTAAQGLINNFIPKLPNDLQDLAPDYVQPIFNALSSASSAYADQTTTSPGCTPPPSSTTTTTTTTSGTVSGTPTTTGTGSSATGTGSASDVWQVYGTSTTPSTGYATATGSSKPTGWSAYGSSAPVTTAMATTWATYGSGSSTKGTGVSTSAEGSAYATTGSSKPTTTGSVKTYTGAAIANNVCIGTVVIAALAAYLL